MIDEQKIRSEIYTAMTAGLHLIPCFRILLTKRKSFR